MKIAVFSDSHGNFNNMLRAVEDFSPDCLVFLGDGYREAERLQAAFPRLPFHYVKGNCDFSPLPPESEIFELGGVRFFIAHGHRYNVKISKISFLNACHFSGANIGLYGHTHRALVETAEDLTIMNPGSCGTGPFPTYGQIFIENGKFTCKIAQIPGENKIFPPLL